MYNATKHPALAAFDKLFGQFSNTMDKAAGIEREEGHKNTFEKIAESRSKRFNKVIESTDNVAGQLENNDDYSL